MMNMPLNLTPPAINPNAEKVLSKRYYRKDENGQCVEDATGLFWRVASSVAAEEAKYEQSPWKPDALARAFYDMMTDWRFLPNSPTLMNAGSELGQLSACFVLPVGDSIEEIFDAVKFAAMIHKSGGGTGFSFSRLRPKNSRVGTTGGVASGPVSFLRIFNTATEQIKQGGTRRGANMGILRIDHPDILEFIRAKEQEGEFNNFNLSVGITEAFMQAVEQDRDYALVNPASGKEQGRLNAREVFNLLVDKAWQSGDPGIIFLDRINRDNPTPAQGEIESTNPCGEQPLLPYEACNLGSLNIAKAMDAGLAGTVETAIRALTSVSEHTRIDAVPSIRRANDEGHAIGLGQMNLHGFLAREGIQYGSEEALDFTDMYFMTVAYHAYRASHTLAVEHGTAFRGFADSAYAKPAGEGNYFDKYTDGRRSLAPRTELVRALFERFGVAIPTEADCAELRDDILRDGIYNQNLQAVPPTGSISYINHSTSSIHPIASKIEIRKEGKLGRVYYPAAYMTNENLEYYKDAFEIGWKAIVDTYAEATQHVDQGLSLTLFFPDTATTRDLNKAQIYAWRKGIKTLYYIRIRQQALEGTEVQGCVSCTL